MEKINLFVNDLLKEKKVTKEQVESAGKLLSTDVGLLTSPNARYLYEVGVIDRKGHILHRPISKSAFNRPVQLWSMFCLIKHDITETLGVSDLNAIVNVMREGETEGERKYPKVVDFIQKGSQLAIEAISRKGSGTKSKKNDFNFDDD